MTMHMKTKHDGEGVGGLRVGSVRSSEKRGGREGVRVC